MPWKLLILGSVGTPREAWEHLGKCKEFFPEIRGLEVGSYDARHDWMDEHGKARMRVSKNLCRSQEWVRTREWLGVAWKCLGSERHDWVRFGWVYSPSRNCQEVIIVQAT